MFAPLSLVLFAERKIANGDPVAGVVEMRFCNDDQRRAARPRMEGDVEDETLAAGQTIAPQMHKVVVAYAHSIKPVDSNVDCRGVVFNCHTDGGVGSCRSDLCRDRVVDGRSYWP